MARAYAGVLGSLACGMILTRGLIAGSSPESTIATACGALFAFSAMGWVAGLLARRFVEESVRARFQAALTSLERQHKQAAKA